MYEPLVWRLINLICLQDSPLVHQFRGFQADLWVPEDPEYRQVLSLQGNHALPKR